MNMLTKEQKDDLERMAAQANAAFAAACRDPNITKEDYDKIRAQWNDAQRRYHESLGF